MPAPRKIAFVLAASDHGSLIVNRFDYCEVRPGTAFGVGHDILETSSFAIGEVNLILKLLDLRCEQYGDGVVAIDCGANIGVHTIECATHMTGWGSVIAIEAQERIYYALAGNIAINNCFNARAIHAAVSKTNGTMKAPVPDYMTPSSFGSLEIRARTETEFIGQKVDYSENRTVDLRTISLDSLNLQRLDFIKLDIEGMEVEALEGGIRAIETFRPILFVESIKTDKIQLLSHLKDWGYEVFDLGPTQLAVHQSDQSLGKIRLNTATGGSAT